MYEDPEAQLSSVFGSIRQDEDAVSFGVLQTASSDSGTTVLLIEWC